MVMGSIPGQESVDNVVMKLLRRSRDHEKGLSAIHCFGTEDANLHDYTYQTNAGMPYDSP